MRQVQVQNCGWPLARTSTGWQGLNGAKRISAAVFHLLNTPLGSYIWAPSYGTRIHQLRTQGMVLEDMADIIKLDIQQAFGTWLPSVLLLDTGARQMDEDQALYLDISWGIPGGAGSTGERQLVYGPAVTTVRC